MQEERNSAPSVCLSHRLIALWRAALDRIEGRVWPVGAVVLVSTAALFWLGPAARKPAGSVPRKPAAADHHLSPALEADWQGTQFVITWERNHPAILNAGGGQLLITDGAIQREITLDQEQLRTGKVIYTPMTHDATFRLVLDRGADALVRGLPPGRPVVAAASVPPLPPTAAQQPTDLVKCYYLQVAAVPSANADSLVSKLQKAGFRTALEPSSLKSSVRVLVGPFEDERALGSARSQLERAKFTPIARTYQQRRQGNAGTAR
jgi:hypothetical protein